MANKTDPEETEQPEPTDPTSSDNPDPTTPGGSVVPGGGTGGSYNDLVDQFYDFLGIMYCSTMNYRPSFEKCISLVQLTPSDLSHASDCYSNASSLMSSAGLSLPSPGSLGDDPSKVPTILYNSHNGSTGWDEVINSRSSVDDRVIGSEVVRPVCSALYEVCNLFGITIATSDTSPDPCNWNYILREYEMLALFAGWAD